jgi:hypothetical protein
MDARLFRLPTEPNFFSNAGTANPFDINQRQKYSQEPTRDIRFPGWAAPMSDGRLVTSYKNHCSQNIPEGKQFATKDWMTHNAEELIRVSRERLAYQTGAIYGLDSSVVPPPAGLVECTRSDCTRTPTMLAGGIGNERAPEEVPELFGTWDPRISAAPRHSNTSITTRYEGGRNTPRGGPAEEIPKIELR